jgi:hypothetical protein
MNLVLVTSCVYTHVSHYYTPEDRYRDLKNTVKSVRTYIPDAYIILLEGGYKEYEKIEKIDEMIYYDISNYSDKSYGELRLIRNFFETCNPILDNCNTISKISGRYYLNANFVFNDNFCYKQILPDSPDNECDHNYGYCLTRYYRFPKSYLSTFLERLNGIESIMINIETTFYIKGVLPKEKSVKKIGVCGYIGHIGEYIED